MLDPDNARIYGSDEDAVFDAPLGTAAPTTLATDLNTEPAAPWEDFGWLGEDGMNLNPSDSVTKFRGHQGGKVVRTKMVTSETQFVFRCLETKAQTINLQFQVKGRTITGVAPNEIARTTFGSGRQVVSRAFLVRLVDEGVIRWFEIPRGEIGERGSLALRNSEMSVYEFTVEIIGDWYELTNDPAVIAGGAV